MAGLTIVDNCSFGSQPVSMKSEVKTPQAINAPILGITIFESDVPSF